MDVHRSALAKTCLDAAYDGTMSFPDIVGALSEAGFDGYMVDYRCSATTYFLPDSDHVVLRNHPSAGRVAMLFDQVGIAGCIRWAQSCASDYAYPAFCEQMKALGCAGYIVSIPGRRVLYFGRTAETHVEHFPSALVSVGDLQKLEPHSHLGLSQRRGPQLQRHLEGRTRHRARSSARASGADHLPNRNRNAKTNGRSLELSAALYKNGRSFLEKPCHAVSARSVQAGPSDTKAGAGPCLTRRHPAARRHAAAGRLRRAATTAGNPARPRVRPHE